MDQILLELQSKSCGLSINSLFLGSLSHADDIHTLSTNLPDCKQQITTVDSFASARSLILSTNKCEAIISPARCLGAWWSTSLSSKKWIQNNIKKPEVPSLPEEVECFMVLGTPCPPEVSLNVVCFQFYFTVLNLGFSACLF